MQKNILRPFYALYKIYLKFKTLRPLEQHRRFRQVELHRRSRPCHLLLYRLWNDSFCPFVCPLDLSRLGRSVGRLRRWTTAFCSRCRSNMIFLQMSLSVLAMCRAGVSQRNTWHMCFLDALSRATYAKSLSNQTSHWSHIYCTTIYLHSLTKCTYVCRHSSPSPLFFQVVN
jgi:hypothetical protein